MSKIVIVDTSCLISLSNSNSLDLLKSAYSEIYITHQIQTEFNEKLPVWIKVLNPSKKKVDEFSRILDLGEASAIALAIENPESLLIIDESKGRRIAKEQNINIIGTIGFLLKIQKSGLIKDAFPIIIRIVNNGFRISTALLNKLIEFYNK
jgi:predicted nucleic acid-binding protein